MTEKEAGSLVSLYQDTNSVMRTPHPHPDCFHHLYPSSPGIVAALTWPASLLSVANVIDNPWGVCLHRSAEVGKHLAHILLSRQQVPRTGWSGGGREQGS